jgi:hypothetical protein
LATLLWGSHEVAGWPAHVAIVPLLCPKGVLVELKREIVEGKGGRRWLAGNHSLADRPCLVATQSLLLSSTSSCSYRTHSTDQKHQKQSKFLSSFSKVFYLFIYLFLKFLDFILCNDEIEMMWKMSKNKKMVDEKGREMQMVGKGQKMKYEITIGLFSRRGRHILGM